VSVHRPGFYAERFMNFMRKTVFKKIPSRKNFMIHFSNVYTTPISNFIKFQEINNALNAIMTISRKVHIVVSQTNAVV